jgi:hypothetical protein
MSIKTKAYKIMGYAVYVANHEELGTIWSRTHNMGQTLRRKGNAVRIYTLTAAFTNKYRVLKKGITIVYFT